MPVIECEWQGDADAVDLVIRAAFPDEPGVADMVRAIRGSAEYEPELALVARAEGSVVGVVMISRAALMDDHERLHDVLTLSPLAVHPEAQRRGIGSALVRDVLARADRQTQLPRLVTLEGDPRYYGRLGFKPAADYGVTIDLPDWAPPEAAQVYRLDGYGGAPRGRVVYPPAFALAAG